MAQRGEIPTVRISKRIVRVPLEALEEHLRARIQGGELLEEGDR
jgi:hypothetical protein